MRKLALALAAVSAMALSVPAFVSGAAAESRPAVSAATKVVKTVRHRGVTKKVVVKRDRWHRHNGWRAHRHGSSRTVIVKRPNGTVVKKKIIHRG